MSAEQSYYAVIPADVRYDKDLRPNAKLLYAELTSLSNKHGYCWATNEYFADLFGLTAATVSRLISQLAAKGYIRCEMAATDKGSERRIYAGTFVVQRGLDKNVNTPVDEKVKGGLDENVNQNNKQEEVNVDNTPLNPPEGDGCATEDPPEPEPPKRRPRRKKSKEPKKAPDWRPERFAQFWDYYGMRVNKQRAIEEWDKLEPDDALIDHMARTLRRQKASELWQRGIGIPQPAQWIKDRRWEDEDVGPAVPHAPPEPRRTWTNDPEVT